MDYLNLCQNISDRVKSVLIKKLSNTGFIGDTCLNPNDLKSTHAIDESAIEIIMGELKNYDCNIFMESVPTDIKENADFSIYVDPVDGSLNWDRGVGDPCIVIAISQKTKNIAFKDLTFGFVEGLRSGDVYYADNGKSFFINELTGKKNQITCKGKSKLSESTAYLRPGYSLAKNQFEGSFPIFFLSKDIRAVDNTGIEICEIARNAADILIETRKESDFYNLLAYPILKNAGGFLSDLKGVPFDDQIIDINRKYDYIACNNPELLREVIETLNEFVKTHKYSYENIKFEF